MDNNQTHQMILEARRIAPLNLRQIRFLIAWFELMGGFGFKGLKDDEQLPRAVEFYLRNEKEWQNEVLMNDMDTSLALYIENKGVHEGVNFPIGFAKLVQGKEREWEKNEG